MNLLKRQVFNLNELDDIACPPEDLQGYGEPGQNIVSLFYQSGYLTIKGFDDDIKMVELCFPNKEVSEGFWKALYRYYVHPMPDDRTFCVGKFAKAVNRGDAEDFMSLLQALVADTDILKTAVTR